MKNEFNELRNYFNEAKRRTQNDRYNAFTLTEYSKHTIKQLELLKPKLIDNECVDICERTIKELRKAPDLLEQYSNTIEYPKLIGNFHLFLKINHTLYNNLEELLDYFNELEGY